MYNYTNIIQSLYNYTNIIQSLYNYTNIIQSCSSPQTKTFIFLEVSNVNYSLVEEVAGKSQLTGNLLLSGLQRFPGSWVWLRGKGSIGLREGVGLGMELGTKSRCLWVGFCRPIFVQSKLQSSDCHEISLHAQLTYTCATSFIFTPPISASFASARALDSSALQKLLTFILKALFVNQLIITVNNKK